METSTTLEVFIKKQFIAKSSNFMLGKKWWMKTNLDRGSPNIFTESTMGEGCVCVCGGVGVGGGGTGTQDSGQRPL